MADLKITTVTAARDGGFMVAFTDGTASAVSLVSAEAHPHSGLLIAWLRAGNIPAKREITIEEARADAGAAMFNRIDRFLATFTAGVPANIVSSWSDKAARARGVVAGKADAALTAEAAALGITALALATKIVAKADAYAMITGTVEAIRSKTATAVGNAKTSAEIDAAMVAAMTQAQAAATKLGLVF